MNPRKKIVKLQQLSTMLLDQKLATLQAAAAARNASLQRLQDLQASEVEGLDPITQAKSSLRYEVWADARRAEINLVLARQTVAWMEARRAAETAFGRAEVLRKIQKKPLR